MHETNRFITIFLLTAGIAIFAASCSDHPASEGSEELDGYWGIDGKFYDNYGRVCDNPTPCGDCDHDCRQGPGQAGGASSGGDGFGSEVCADLQVELDAAIPRVVLLIDQSGSMEQRFGDRSRWDATYDVLMDSNAGIIRDLQEDFELGLALYTSFNGGDTCPVITEVSPAVNNYQAMEEVLAQAEPEDDTPTGEAIEAIIPMFKGAEADGPKVILLATDGMPDSCSQPDPQDGEPESIAGAQRAFQHGIATYVLSVGPEVRDDHLQDMANAGVGYAIGGPQNAPFYKANDPAALEQAMRDILDNSRTCIFKVDGGTIDPQKAREGTVTVNGQALPYGDPNGWVFHQNSPRCFGADQCIELQGEACEQIQVGEATIAGDFPCVYQNDGSGSGSGGSSGGSGDGSGGDGTGSGSGDGSGGDGSGDGSGSGGDGSSSGDGSGSGGDGSCRPASDACEDHGDCCSGICGFVAGRGVCVLP